MTKHSRHGKYLSDSGLDSVGIANGNVADSHDRDGVHRDGTCPGIDRVGADSDDGNYDPTFRVHLPRSLALRYRWPRSHCLAAVAVAVAAEPESGSPPGRSLVAPPPILDPQSLALR